MIRRHNRALAGERLSTEQAFDLGQASRCPYDPPLDQQWHNKVAANRLGSQQAECAYANVVSKIFGGQIVGASAPTDVNLRSRRAYHITVAIERAQEAGLVGAGIRLNSPQCVLVYEE